MAISTFTGNLALELNERGFRQTEDAEGSATFVNDAQNVTVNVSVCRGGDFADLVVSQHSALYDHPLFERRIVYADRHELDRCVAADATKIVDRNITVDL